MSRTRTFPGAYHSPTTPTSATSSVFSDPDDVSAYVDATDEDPIARELAVLDELRRNVQKNLKLRPISPNNLSAQPRNNNSNSNNNITNNHNNNNHNNHSNRNSTQFHHPPQTPFSAVSNVSSNLPFYTPTENWPAFRLHSRTDSQDSRRLSASSFSSYYFYDDSDDEEEDVDDQTVDYDPSKPRPFQPNTLLRALLRHPSDSPRRLLIDTRPAGSYLASRLPFSLNIAIPSLILKRCLKPGGGFAALSSLRAFISTERGKASWDSLLNTPGAWDGTAIIYDEDMDESDPLAPAPPPSVSASGSSSMAWTLLSVLKPLIPGTVYFLRGGISAIRRLPRGLDLIVSGEREVEVEGAPLESPADLEHHVNLRDSLQILPDAHGGLTLAPAPTKRGTAQKGLFQLRTDVAARHRPMPELEPPTTSPGPPLSPRRSVTIDIPPSPHHGTTPDTSTNTDSSETPSPPRSAIPPPTSHRPTLARLDIKGPKGTTERLKAAAPPKLQLQLQLKTPAPARSATLPAPPTAAGKGPKLKLRLDTPAVHPNTFNAASVTIMNIPSSPEESSGSSNDNLMSPPPSSPRSFITAPRSPGTPLPPSPMTARPMDEDASPAPEFVISTILPGFLFLGPEIVLPEQAAQLEERGVKRILNIAIECDDDQGLNLRQRFEKYIRIPMRDTVEEANVAKRMREVCDFLGAYFGSSGSILSLFCR